jgi:hypothetical protein
MSGDTKIHNLPVESPKDGVTPLNKPPKSLPRFTEAETIKYQEKVDDVFKKLNYQMLLASFPTTEAGRFCANQSGLPYYFGLKKNMCKPGLVYIAVTVLAQQIKKVNGAKDMVWLRLQFPDKTEHNVRILTPYDELIEVYEGWIDTKAAMVSNKLAKGIHDTQDERDKYTKTEQQRKDNEGKAESQNVHVKNMGMPKRMPTNMPTNMPTVMSAASMLHTGDGAIGNHRKIVKIVKIDKNVVAPQGSFKTIKEINMVPSSPPSKEEEQQTFSPGSDSPMFPLSAWELGGELEGACNSPKGNVGEKRAHDDNKPETMQPSSASTFTTPNTNASFYASPERKMKIKKVFRPDEVLKACKELKFGTAPVNNEATAPVNNEATAPVNTPLTASTSTSAVTPPTSTAAVTAPTSTAAVTVPTTPTTPVATAPTSTAVPALAPVQQTDQDESDDEMPQTNFQCGEDSDSDDGPEWCAPHADENM